MNFMLYVVCCLASPSQGGPHVQIHVERERERERERRNWEWLRMPNDSYNVGDVRDRLRVQNGYGVATISRLLKITGLFCRISSFSWGSFAKETYIFWDCFHLQNGCLLLHWNAMKDKALIMKHMCDMTHSYASDSYVTHSYVSDNCAHGDVQDCHRVQNR